MGASDLDQDGDGDIAGHEFKDYMLPILVREESLQGPVEEAERMFDIIDCMDEDSDGNGDAKITTLEFKHLLEHFGNDMSFEEIRELFHEYDENMDGYLQREEFVRMMLSSGLTT